MHLTSFLKALVRLVPLIALGMVAGPLTFRPAPGSALTKQLDSKWNVHLEEMELAINGRVWLPGYTMETEVSQHIAITDTYLALLGGRPMALDRDFHTVSQNVENSLGRGAGLSVWEDLTGTSELEGAIVQFRRKGGAYTKQFDPLDRYLDKALLDGLTEDMDLRALLPKKPVTVGDEWEIHLASLPDLLSPGGYFAWTIESGGTARWLSESLDSALMGELRHVLASMLEGHATVEYLGEEDGHSQLGITIDVQGTPDVDDLSKLATNIANEFSARGEIEIERLDLTLALEAEGTAEWNTDRGHISHLELKGHVRTAMDLEVVMDLASKFFIGLRTVVSGDFVQEFDTR